MRGVCTYGCALTVKAYPLAIQGAFQLLRVVLVAVVVLVVVVVVPAVWRPRLLVRSRSQCILPCRVDFAVRARSTAAEQAVQRHARHGRDVVHRARRRRGPVRDGWIEGTMGECKKEREWGEIKSDRRLGRGGGDHLHIRD